MTNSQDKKTVALIGAGVEAGSGRQGCRMGPDALRIAGMMETLQGLNRVVLDMGNVAPRSVEISIPGNANEASEVAGWVYSLHEEGLKAFRAGHMPIFLGGDHSLSMGSVAAALEYAEEVGRPLHVLWIDAHADFNTPQTSPSGNMHGMSSAYFCGEEGFEGLTRQFPSLPYQNLHIFGARSIDPMEKKRLAAQEVDVHDMRLLDEFGVAKLMRHILETVVADDAMLHVSFDVDFLDPGIAPGVGTTVPGGATFREAHLVMEMIGESNLMSSLDLVELNPFLDERGKSARLLVDLTASAFGETILDRQTPVYGD